MSIAVFAVGRNIEKQDIDAGIRQLAGNTEPHCACPDNGSLVNFVHQVSGR